MTRKLLEHSQPCCKRHGSNRVTAHLLHASSTCRLLEGKSGIKEITRFDASEFPTRFGGQIENFDIEG